MTQSRNSVGVPAKNPTRYTGPKASLVPIVKYPRQPLVTDKLYPIGQIWIIGDNPSTGASGDLWYLGNFLSDDAIWAQFDKSIGSVGIDYLRDQVNAAVGPDGTGNVDLDALIVANGANPSGIALETVAGVNAINIQLQVSTDRTGAPGNKSDVGLCCFDDTGFTVDTDGYVSLVGGAAIPLSFPTDAGTATPAANALTVAGGTGINSSGAGSTVTVNLDVPVVEIHGGTNQITYAKGDILYASAVDTLAKLTIGTDGQVLQVATDIPSWGASPGGSGIVYLATATAAASATLEFTSLIDATYNSYLFIYDHIYPASDGVIFTMRTSTDGGVSYSSTGGDYQSQLINVTAATTTTEISVSAEVGNVANETMSGQTTLINPSGAAYATTYSIGGGKGSDGTLKAFHGAGMRLSAADVDAVQFLFKTGNIASGTIKMYGLTTPA